MVLAWIVAGCGDDEVPTCEQAIAHYYDDASCTYSNGYTIIPREGMLEMCEQWAAVEGCERELNTWLVCVNEVGEDCGACWEQIQAVRSCV
jgi:hypothetical protein